MDTPDDILLNERELDDLLDAWTQRIVEELGDLDGLALVGIHTRGVPLARRLQTAFRDHADRDLPMGLLDITLYRDDLSRPGTPTVRGTEILFDLEDRPVLLVDDVLFTGRTVRAGLDELFDFGRPGRVILTVLVDRGGRELPIQPDYAGKTLSVSPDRMVRLRLGERDERHAVIVE